jgi:hypothetical protein
MAKRAASKQKRLGRANPDMSHNMFCDPMFCLMADGRSSDDLPVRPITGGIPGRAPLGLFPLQLHHGSLHRLIPTPPCNRPPCRGPLRIIEARRSVQSFALKFRFPCGSRDSIWSLQIITPSKPPPAAACDRGSHRTPSPRPLSSVRSYCMKGRTASPKRRRHAGRRCRGPSNRAS